MQARCKFSIRSLYQSPPTVKLGGRQTKLKEGGASVGEEEIKSTTGIVSREGGVGDSLAIPHKTGERYSQ